MGFIEGSPAPKRYRDPPVLFQILSSLDLHVSSQQAKFERKFIVSSISTELP